MYVTSRAFICRREKWNYNKVKWSSNDPAGFAYSRSRCCSLSLSLSLSLFLSVLPAWIKYKVPSLNFVLHHFIAADVPFVFRCSFLEFRRFCINSRRGKRKNSRRINYRVLWRDFAKYFFPLVINICVCDKLTDKSLWRRKYESNLQVMISYFTTQSTCNE